jgi:hypothetical protein
LSTFRNRNCFYIRHYSPYVKPSLFAINASFASVPDAAA